ncbi:MAG: hypothetical protein ACFCU7_10930, partial [Pleurocapsa sp.]
HWRTMEFRKRVPNIEASLCLFEYIHQFEYLCLVKKRDAPVAYEQMILSQKQLCEYFGWDYKIRRW